MMWETLTETEKEEDNELSLTAAAGSSCVWSFGSRAQNFWATQNKNMCVHTSRLIRNLVHLISSCKTGSGRNAIISDLCIREDLCRKFHLVFLGFGGICRKKCLGFSCLSGNGSNQRSKKEEELRSSTARVANNINTIEIIPQFAFKAKITVHAPSFSESSSGFFPILLP